MEETYLLNISNTEKYLCIKIVKIIKKINQSSSYYRENFKYISVFTYLDIRNYWVSELGII